MTDIARSILEWVSRRLEHDEREAVLGDLSEGGISNRRAAIEITGLVVRRYVAVWHDWRPWLAALGVALPSTFLLMGASFSIGCSYQRLIGAQSVPACPPAALPDSLLLGSRLVLLLIWSWAVGFIAACVSRRTLRVSGALCVLPCVYCLTRFQETSLTQLCLLLFVPPAIAGAYRGLRAKSIRRGTSMSLATGVTMLVFGAWMSGALLAVNWALILTVWFIVLMAWRPDWWRPSSN